MRFLTVFDANQEAKINEIIDALDEGRFAQYFEDRFYDDSSIKMTIVLMCRSPDLHFKQRIRFSRKENKLYIDLMLELEQMRDMNLDSKKKIVGEKFINEVPQIVAKYKFKDFDLSRFSADLRQWFKENHWL